MKNILALVPLLAIHGAVLAREITVTESSHQKTVVLKHDDTLHVALKGNPSTGYSWDVVSNNNAVLALNNVSFEPFRSGVIGSPGFYTFTFQPTAEKGHSHLKLAYARPWEKEKKPHSTFKIVVKVQK